VFLESVNSTAVNARLAYRPAS